VRCRQCEKWISDLLDGRLKKSKQASLEKHLLECPSCQVYKTHLEKIREETRRMERPKLTPQYKEDFSSRLKNRLQSDKKKERWVSPSAWPWIYGAAGAALFAILVLVLQISQPRISRLDESFVLSPSGSLSGIYSEISSSPELEELFNWFVLVSIDDTLAELGWNEESFFLENPLDQLGLTEVELRLVETAIKEDIETKEKKHEV
jgi:hypothetical protein